MDAKNLLKGLAKLGLIILIVMALYRYLGFLGIWLVIGITFGFAGFIIWKRWDLFKLLCLYGAKQLDKTISRGEVFGTKKSGRGTTKRAGDTTTRATGRTGVGDGASNNSSGCPGESKERN